MRVFVFGVLIFALSITSLAQEKAQMRKKFLNMINTDFDSLGKLHAERYAHVLTVDGNVVPPLYSGKKFPVTLSSALRNDTPFDQIKFVELIHTNDAPHDTLWHSSTKMWSKKYQDSTHTSTVRRVDVGNALASYIGVHKLDGKPVNVIAENLSNPQALKRFIDVRKINPDEMIVIYYETEHGFYLGYKRM
jgi:hypothetical protein